MHLICVFCFSVFSQSWITCTITLFSNVWFVHEGDWSLFHFNKDGGLHLHAILVLTIGAWGRYVSNVTLNDQTSETREKKKIRFEQFALEPLNFGAECVRCNVLLSSCVKKTNKTVKPTRRFRIYIEMEEERLRSSEAGASLRTTDTTRCTCCRWKSANIRDQGGRTGRACRGWTWGQGQVRGRWWRDSTANWRLTGG